jgi:hypothetical protein
MVRGCVGQIFMGTDGTTFPSNIHNLALLIEERDEILENLEVAETRYKSSFRISALDPSIADLEVLAPSGSQETPSRPHIGRPRALVGSVIVSYPILRTQLPIPIIIHLPVMHVMPQ